MTAFKDIGKEMRVQDNRSTQYPLFVVVEDVKRYHVTEGEGRERINYEDIDWANDICGKCSREYDDSGQLPDECDCCDDDSYVRYAIDRDVPNLRAGVFFTAKACDEHIVANHYHYDESAKSYAIGAWRNEEMQVVMHELLFAGREGNL